MLARILLGAIGTFLAAVLQLALAPAGMAGAICAAALGGALVFGWLVLVREARRWVSIPVAGIGCCAGLLVSGQPPAIAALLVVGAMAVAGVLTLSLRPKRREVCSLCRQTSAHFFACPRCRYTVCDRGECWDFQGVRCTRCRNNHVKLLPVDLEWWNRTFAPAGPDGQCRSCKDSGDDRRLFACSQCPEVYCQSCWDDRNGQCERCGWFSASLPQAVREYLFRP